MGRGKAKPKTKCKCDFCQALITQTNREELFTECGFLFDFEINILTWREQVAIGEVRELYPVPIIGQRTAFFVEKDKIDSVKISSANKITAITGVAWQYVTCHNQNS